MEHDGETREDEGYADFLREEERKSRRFAWKIRAIEEDLVPQGYTAWMLTVTLPSKAGRLKDRVQRLRQVVRDAVGRHIATTGPTTTVYALEVTASDDGGWHPHLHSVTFTLRDAPVQLDCLRCHMLVRGYGRTRVDRVKHGGYLTYIAKCRYMRDWGVNRCEEYARSLYRVRRFGLLGWHYGDPYITLRAGALRRGVRAAYSIANAIKWRPDGLPTRS